MTEIPGSFTAGAADRAPAANTSARHPVLITGLYTGCLLVVAMLAALIAANRIPGLERYALERNAASYCMFALFMLIPVFRFLDRPVKLFAAAMLAWIIFVLAYELAGIVFVNLFLVLRTPFQALIEGGAIYGVVAAGSWVGGMILEAKRHPIAARRPPGQIDSHLQ